MYNPNPQNYRAPSQNASGPVPEERRGVKLARTADDSVCGGQMSTRLGRVRDWLGLASAACYDAERLATLLGVSQRRLQRYFRRRGSCPPQEWLYRVRIWVAGQRLLEGKSHKVVAGDLHFKDMAHFYHQFRRFHGMTPSDFVDKVYLAWDDSRFLPDGNLAPSGEDVGVRHALGQLAQPLSRRSTDGLADQNEDAGSTVDLSRHAASPPDTKCRQ